MTPVFFIIINSLILLVYKLTISSLLKIIISLKKKKINLKKIKFIIKKYKCLTFIYNLKFNKGIIKTNNIIIIFI